MNKDVNQHVNAPENAPAHESTQFKFSHQNELKHNREVGHLMKGGAQDRHVTKRSMPHVRGR